ncbi:MAG: phosphomannomutase/phosphoglucomutase [Deltaproteobacteria bacterium]|nr:phosphomannomutase/phosphoglucomutase [Deltaproteobacteria bacterium]
MDDQGVVDIGKGIGTYLRRHGCTELTVGQDCRLSSASYAGLVIDGLMSTGCRVTDIGVCTTPISYFSVRHLEKEGNVMVTASHNPPEYNGFKVCRGLDSVFGEQIQQIRTIIDEKKFVTGTGHLAQCDVRQDYIDTITTNISLSRPLRVGVDAGNGTAGPIVLPIFKALGCEVFDLYCDMDGRFPNHEADPTVIKNMNDLVSLVREKKLDVGIGFDGDGDRIGVVDHQGNLIFGDQLMIIFSREILSRKPGATFIAEVKCSQTLYDDIEKHGGRAIMYKTGHSLIKKKMKEENAALAGEMSGHMFFSDRYFGYDDAAYAACRLLEILADTHKTIPDLLGDVPKTFSTPEIRVECPDDRKFDVVAKVTEHFRSLYKVVDIDGARVIFDDGWGLVRASNTQPALVLRFEALTEGRLTEIRDLMESALEKIKSQ